MATGSRMARLALLIEAQGAQRARGEVEGVSGATRRLGTSAEVAGAKTSLASKASARFTSTLRGMGRAMKYGALAATGLALVLGRSAVNATLDLENATIRLRQVTGMSTRSASEWIGIGKVWGVEGSRVTNIFARLGKQMLAAKEGNKAAITTFTGLGVSMATIRKGNVDKLIGGIADRMKSMRSATDRAGLATQLFGRGMGTKMLPMLIRGHAGIDELKKKLLEAGATFSNTAGIKKQIEAHHLFEISMLGLQVTLGKVLIPALTVALNKISGFIAYVRKHWPEIKAFFAPIINWVAGKIRWLADHFKHLSPVLKTVAVGIAAAFAIAFGGPVVTILALGVLAATVVKNWKPVSKFFTDLWKTVNRSFATAVSWIKHQLGVSTADLRNFWQAVKTIFKVAIGVLVVAFHILWPVIKRTFSGIVTGIRGAVRVIGGVIQVIGGVITGHWSRAWHGLRNIVSGSFQAVFGFFKTISAPFRTAFMAIFHGIGSAVSSIFNGVMSVIKSAISFVIGVLNQMIDSYNAVGGWATGNIAKINDPFVGTGDPAIVNSGGNQTIKPPTTLGALPKPQPVKPHKPATSGHASKQGLILHPRTIAAMATAFGAAVTETPIRAYIDGKETYQSNRRQQLRAAARTA